ncbi:hypothetical protein [Pantoea sp. Morm]|uniref:hypothetical protein n=1 Tax=Pantoea sp. Morm TaxID=2601250 RepID=UPI0031FC3D5B
MNYYQILRQPTVRAEMVYDWPLNPAGCGSLAGSATAEREHPRHKPALGAEGNWNNR